MKITKYAKDKLLDGDLVVAVQADVIIKFQENYGDLYADIYLTERNGIVPIFKVEEGIPIQTGSFMDRGELRIQGASVSVELLSNE
jgi:hypothetical protein